MATVRDFSVDDRGVVRACEGSACLGEGAFRKLVEFGNTYF